MTEAAHTGVAVRRLRRRAASERRWGTATLMLGLGGLVLVAVGAIFAPLIAPYSPNALDVNHLLVSPSWSHLMGTDDLGRDVFSRVLYGAGTDLKVVLIITYGPLILGIGLGAVSGYVGGWVDNMVVARI